MHPSEVHRDEKPIGGIGPDRSLRRSVYKLKLTVCGFKPANLSLRLSFVRSASRFDGLGLYFFFSFELSYKR
jgi:hypothetical protein